MLMWLKDGEPHYLMHKLPDELQAALTASGCRHVAVIGAIMEAADPGQAVRDLLDSLSQPVA